MTRTHGRDAELRKLEAMEAHTLQQKIFVEQRKAEIEIEYLERLYASDQMLSKSSCNCLKIVLQNGEAAQKRPISLNL